MHRTKSEQAVSTRVCPDCTHEGHDRYAEFCKLCGDARSGKRRSKAP